MNPRKVNEIAFQIIQSLKIYQNLLTRALKPVTSNLDKLT